MCGSEFMFWKKYTNSSRPCPPLPVARLRRHSLKSLMSPDALRLHFDGDFDVEIGRNWRRGFQRKGRKEVDAKGAKFLDRIHRIDRIFFFSHESSRIDTNFLYYGKRGNQRKETEPSTPTTEECGRLYAFFASSSVHGLQMATFDTGEKPKSAALWLKSDNGSVPASLLIFACWSVKHGLRGSADTRSTEVCPI